MFVRAKKRGEVTYLQIVENQWRDGRVKQTILHSLGRLDELDASGALDRFLSSATRFSRNLAVLNAHERGESVTTRTSIIGPQLIFERLWRELSIDKVIAAVARGRSFGFSLERAIYLTVLHRLCVSGSDRAAEKWKERHAIPGADELALQHLYRAMAWLGEIVAVPDPPERAPRCTKDLIEEQLFARRRTLLTGLDLVFFDTTSLYFEGHGGETIGEYGHSKDHRPDLRQMVVGMVLDREGNPICSEIRPGNATDVTSLVPVVERLRRRFGIERVCIVADRGMISETTIKQIEERGWHYILGARMRRCTEVRDEVLSRAGRYHEVFPKSPIKKDPAPLQVKEVRVEERRYVVCLNVDEATKDRHDREAILASLRDALMHGDKSLIGNKGYRRFVKSGGERFEIDSEKVEQEARFDGKWVLRTNTDLAAAEVALAYKQLWTVEDIFRSMKSVLETRPIYHKRDATIRGHAFCSFLALVLRKELQDRIEGKGWKLEWNDVIRDLNDLRELQITTGGKGFLLRTETAGTIGKVFQACGVALPPTLRPLEG